MPQPITLSPGQVALAVALRQHGRPYKQIAITMPCGGTKIREVCVAAIGPTKGHRALYAPKDGARVRGALRMRERGATWRTVAQVFGYSSAKCAGQAAANHKRRKCVVAGRAA